MSGHTTTTAPRVWNKRENHPTDAVYVGRPSKWGNPFTIGPNHDRAEVIRAFRDWLNNTPVGRRLCAEARAELRGKHLVCWCAPLPCHADLLLEIANAE